MPSASPSYIELAPSPALAPLVECYWAITAEHAAGSNRVLPDGCADVIAGIPHLAGPAVVGTMRTAALYLLAGRVDLFGVRFRPGGALPVLDLPLGELTDRRVALADLGSAPADLARAMEPAPVAERVARTERVLLARFGGGLASGEAELVTRAVALLRRSRGSARIAEVAEALGVGERRLQRAFELAVGLSPRALARVLRFRRAVRAIALAGARPVRWAALAAETGYADQPHLIREFRALAGVTPARYAAERRAVGIVQYGERAGE